MSLKMNKIPLKTTINYVKRLDIYLKKTQHYHNIFKNRVYQNYFIQIKNIYPQIENPLF